MRPSGVGGIMRMRSQALKDAEIEALAHHYASLGRSQD